MKLPADPLELASLMGRRLDGALAYLGVLDSYFEGTQPSTFLSPESLAAMNGRLPRLGINVVRLAVLSLAERLRVLGFRLDGADEADPEVWASWTRSAMQVGSDSVHVDALVAGRSYVSVWGDEYGDPLLCAESPRQMTTISDPATRRVRAALKRYHDQLDPDTGTGQGHAVLYLPDRVLTYETSDDQPVSGYPPMGGAWQLVESLPNPLGVVPVVPFINGYGRRILGAAEGESEILDVASLNDSLNKLAADMMVSSEVAARPRRWATGLELVAKRDPATGEPVLDDDGAEQFVNPFSSDATRVWQSEDPETKFGQFPAADLSPYTAAMSAVMEKVSAVTTVPGHYLGIGQDQPPSADGIRAAEASLTSRAIGKQRMYDAQWARVAALEVAMRTGRPVDSVAVETLWASAETRTPSQDSDEAAKLSGIGVPLEVVLGEVLGWTPDQVATVRQARLRQALDAQAIPSPQPAPPEAAQ